MHFSPRLLVYSLDLGSYLPFSPLYNWFILVQFTLFDSRGLVHVALIALVLPFFSF